MNAPISGHVALSLLALTWSAPVLAAEPAERETLETELRRLTHELMDAVAPGDKDVWRRILHDDMLYLDENGTVYDKETLIGELQPLPVGLVGRIEVDRFEVALDGDTAVAAAEVQEYLDYHGQPLHSRFRSLSTWLRTADGWRLVGHHVAAVLKDPPAIAMTADELCAYAGVYELTPEITSTVRCTDGGLVAQRSDRPEAAYQPEARDVFFVAGQPRTRRIFSRDAAGRVDGFVDRREGEDIRWRRVGDAAAGDAAASVEEIVKALDTEYQSAVARRDLETMSRILADDFMLVTGTGRVATKQDVLAQVADPALVFERQESSQQTVRVWGDTAVITALLWAKGTRAGEPFEYRLWFSDTYVRTPGGWRYVLGQAAQPLAPPAAGHS